MRAPGRSAASLGIGGRVLRGDVIEARVDELLDDLHVAPGWSWTVHDDAESSDDSEDVSGLIVDGDRGWDITPGLAEMIRRAVGLAGDTPLLRGTHYGRQLWYRSTLDTGPVAICPEVRTPNAPSCTGRSSSRVHPMTRGSPRR